MRGTTDPQDELFDVLDCHGNPTGEVRPRGVVHREGLWHRGLHIWVYSINDEGTAFMLFQRRSMGKDTWPGALDVAVGGHFGAGETLEDALRETEEEIGLQASVNDLTRLGRRFIDWHGPGYIDREVNEAYALRCDQPLRSYRLHPDEVDGIVSIDLDAVHTLFHGFAETAGAVEVLRTGEQRTLTLRMEDFAGERDAYLKAVTASIRIIAAGITPEPFLLRP